MATTPLAPSLEEIIAYKRMLVDQQRVVTPLESLRALAKMQDRPHDVSSHIRENHVALLAQISNPKLDGPPAPNADETAYDPVALARELVRQGAQALVVPTDKRYFGGGVVHLTLVANAVAVPVIRRDYILDEYQVVETRAAGADGLILDVAMLDALQARRLISATQRNLMTAVVQVHNREELETVLPFEPRVIAIHNRDPLNGHVDLGVTARLVELVPGHITVVTMGGLRGPQQIGRVLSVVDGVLLGQNTLFDPDTAREIRRLLGIASLPPLVDANPASQR